jgi:hypothetical protein
MAPRRSSGRAGPMLPTTLLALALACVLHSSGVEANSKDVLVLYLYSSSDPQYRVNLDYFIKEGMEKDSRSDFFVLVPKKIKEVCARARRGPPAARPARCQARRGRRRPLARRPASRRQPPPTPRPPPAAGRARRAARAAAQRAVPARRAVQLLRRLWLGADRVRRHQPLALQLLCDDGRHGARALRAGVRARQGALGGALPAPPERPRQAGGAHHQLPGGAVQPQERAAQARQPLRPGERPRWAFGGGARLLACRRGGCRPGASSPRC